MRDRSPRSRRSRGGVGSAHDHRFGASSHTPRGAPARTARGRSVSSTFVSFGSCPKSTLTVGRGGARPTPRGQHRPVTSPMWEIEPLAQIPPNVGSRLDPTPTADWLVVGERRDCVRHHDDQRGERHVGRVGELCLPSCAGGDVGGVADQRDEPGCGGEDPQLRGCASAVPRSRPLMRKTPGDRQLGRRIAAADPVASGATPG